MLMYLAKILTKHSRTFRYQENINLLVFICFIRIWRGIGKSLAFPGEQSIWSQDNQRHEVFCFSLKIFIHELLWGLHDWFGSLGMDYGRYGRWPPLPPSLSSSNQSFRSLHPFIHEKFPNFNPIFRDSGYPSSKSLAGQFEVFPSVLISLL